ncbi:MAG: right-handed parallel beta-helix repeat-containing protein, partial [Thermoplasmata archaeon]|nr:right-handed parallel beta-helix repeat-containing protein [Thermoplasmata archaeon]
MRWMKNSMLIALMMAAVMLLVPMGTLSMEGPKTFPDAVMDLSTSSSVSHEGIVGMWAGTFSSIPNGWTYISEMADKFVLGDSTSQGNGGATEHKHTYTDMPTHTHTIPSSGAHTHDFSHTDVRCRSSSSTNGRGVGSSSGTRVRTSSDGSHTHTVNSTGSSSAETSSSSNLPPYIELIYLQKTDASETIPEGMILFWSGLVSTIPDGWGLCDGNSSNPDLRSTFYRGASLDEDAGSTGGTTSHRHTYTETITHTHTLNSAGRHDHDYQFRRIRSTFSGSAVRGTSTGATTITTTSEGSHSHELSVEGTSVCYTEDENNLPPYYKLAPMIKVDGDGPLPSNAIFGWWDVSQAPGEFGACDGTKGTPDLVDVMIMGVGPGEGPGATGGSTQHQHSYSDVPRHGHGTSTDGDHTHTSSFSTTYGNGDPGPTDMRGTSTGSSSSPTESAGDHTHTVSKDGATDCKTSNSDDLPPYRTMVYMMRSSVYNEDKEEWYSTIQAAVDDADAGDDLFLTNGTYLENVIVGKTLTMSANFTGQALINGLNSDHTMEVKGKNVQITGLNFTNSWDYSGLYIIGDGPILDEVTCHDSTDGLWLKGVNGAEITGSNFNNCTSGILIDGSSNIGISDSILSDNTASVNISNVQSLTIQNCTMKDSDVGVGTSGSTINSILVNGSTFNGDDRSLELYGDNVSVTNNSFSDSSEWAVTAGQGSDQKVAFNTFESCEKGIYLNGARWADVTGNELDGVGYGMSIYDSYLVDISGNMVNSTGKGIVLSWAQSVEVTDNGIDAVDLGISIMNSDTINISDSRIAVSGEGITISDGMDLNIWNNSIYAWDIGITALSSDNNTIRDNIISGNQSQGIILDDCMGHNLLRNEVLNSSLWSIKLLNSDNNTLFDNVLMENSYGVVIEGSYENLIQGNHISDSSENGILVRSSFGNEIRSNMVLDNRVGIKLRDTVENSIYDNHIDSIIMNTDVLNSDNDRWNTTYSLGTNIIGGDHIGGNFWSDYDGLDTDGDWIGDTAVPHGPGDMLPLAYDLVAPVITDITTETPTTGEVFIISASVGDEREVASAWAHYWIDDDDPVNVSLALSRSNVMYVDIDIPWNRTGSLNFVIYANDTSENLISTSTSVLEIVDNDLPELVEDSSVQVAYTGDPLTITADLSDNIGIDTVRVHLFNSVLNVTLSMTSDDDITWSVTTYAPLDSLEDIEYVIYVLDTSENQFETVEKSIPVIDNDRPVFVDLLSPSIGYTGDLYTFEVNISDNIEIDEVWISFEGGMANITLSPGDGDAWSGEWSVPEDLVGDVNISCHALDSTGSEMSQFEFAITIIDNDPPSLLNLSYPEEIGPGKEIEILIEARDNLGIEALEIYYSMPGEAQRNALLEPVNGSYSFTIGSGDDLGNITFSLLISDEQWNNVTSEEFTINVIDDVLPICTITDPADGNLVSGVITIGFNMSD